MGEVPFVVMLYRLNSKRRRVLGQEYLVWLPQFAHAAHDRDQFTTGIDGQRLLMHLDGEPHAVVDTTRAASRRGAAGDSDGRLRAFHNSCLHRGRMLKRGTGNATELRCPYHSFAWNLDGRFTGAPFPSGQAGNRKRSGG